MSEASKGIRVSPTQCGDLALTLSGCSKEKNEYPVFQGTKSTLLKSFLVLSCTDKLFAKYTAGIADPAADPLTQRLPTSQLGKKKSVIFLSVELSSP